jgi:hypothetical protein
MARVMWDTTDVYRAMVRYEAPWTMSGESSTIYGPYDGPTGKGQARRRIKDQHSEKVIEGKVQKLAAELIYDGSGEWSAKLEWVDVDD